MTYEEAEEYTGTRVVYNHSQAPFGESICNNPTYSPETLGKDEFLSWTHTTFEELGVTGESIVKVDVMCESASPDWLHGKTFFVAGGTHSFTTR